MSVTTSHWRMADRVLNGTLADTLANLYRESRSWEEVARRLYADHGLTVSGQTLRRWGRELDIPGPTKASA
jgi:hypothetical protein